MSLTRSHRATVESRGVEAVKFFGHAATSLLRPKVVRHATRGGAAALGIMSLAGCYAPGVIVVNSPPPPYYAPPSPSEDAPNLSWPWAPARPHQLIIVPEKTSNGPGSVPNCPYVPQ